MRFLWLRRKWWTLYKTARYPRESFRAWWKWHERPGVGDLVVDCRGRYSRVTGFGATEDDLILDDGYRCSWMHCCDYPEDVSGQGTTAG